MTDFMTNQKINNLFVKVTNLIRMVRNDCASGTNKDYPIIADVHKTAIDIDDEVLMEIGKISVDEIHINLYEFKRNPYEYIKMMKEYFYDEIRKIDSLKKESDERLDKLIFQYNLDRHQMELVEMYKGLISDKILYRYQQFGQVNPLISYDEEKQKLILQVGKEIIRYDLKGAEQK